MSYQVSFDFYGTTIRVQSPSDCVLKILETEFAFFRADVPKPLFEVELVHSAAPFGLLPERPASRISSNSLTYDEGPVRWNDYHGKALSRYDYELRRAVIWCADHDFLHEVTYLLILSLTGKELDQRGLHKVHACGIRYQGRDILVMLPSMGGKTTLFLELARIPGVELISDDTPLIDEAGQVLPFPLRVGVETVPSYLQGEFPLFKRRQHTAKFLIPLSALEAPLAQGHGGAPILVFGARWPSPRPFSARLSPLPALKELMTHLVIGVGLPMVVEYFLQHTWRDWWRLTRITFGRAQAALRLWQRGESWQVFLGTDSAANARAILALVKRP